MSSHHGKKGWTSINIRTTAKANITTTFLSVFKILSVGRQTNGQINITGHHILHKTHYI